MSHRLAAYEALARHARLELELARAGEIERLVPLAERWERLIAGLPAHAPAAAAPLLEQARATHARTQAELASLRERLHAQLADAARARRAAGGYALQARRRPRLQRSA